MNSWFKYTYVCNGECDALLEYTFQSGYTPNDFNKLICLCGSSTTLMSVVDATINHLTERNNMLDNLEASMETIETTMDISEIYNPELLVTLRSMIDCGDIQYHNRKVREIDWDMEQYRKLRKDQNEWWAKESRLRDIITEAYQDSEDQHTLLQIAEMFGIPMTKQIEYTATITINGIVEVDLTDVYDLADVVYENLSIQGNGELDVHDFDIDSVEEL